MNEKTVIALLLLGGVLFVLCTKMGGGKYKIEKMDFVLLFIPLLIWMIGTGRIQKLVVGVLSVIAPWIENYVPTSWIKNS